MKKSIVSLLLVVSLLTGCTVDQFFATPSSDTLITLAASQTLQFAVPKSYRPSMAQGVYTAASLIANQEGITPEQFSAILQFRLPSNESKATLVSGLTALYRDQYNLWQKTGMGDSEQARRLKNFATDLMMASQPFITQPAPQQ